MRTVALVSCSKEKRPAPAMARFLYRSQLFAKSLAYAESITPTTFVLSAQHGLVEPDQVLEPYDLSLQEMDPDERAWFGLAVIQALHDRFGDQPLRIVILAGQLYEVALTSYAVDCPTWSFEAPLAGMQIGRRLSWLTQQLHGAVAA